MFRSATLTVLFATLSLGAAAQAPDGTLLVANRDGGSVSFFDAATATELARLPVGPRIPHEIAISPDGRVALTSEYGTDDAPGRTLLVINVASATYVGEIDLGPGGDEVWVVNRGDESISVVDTGALEIVDAVETPPNPRRAEISEAGRVLVPSGGGASEPRLTLYGLDTREQVAQHELSEAGGGPLGVHVVDERAFVSDLATGAISIYDLERFPSSRLLTGDHEVPDGLGFAPHRLNVLED